MINGRTYYLGVSEERDRELLEVQDIARKESGQAQFKKQGLCAALIVCVFIMNYLLPSTSHESPVGLGLCSVPYWSFEVLFVIVCGLATWLAVKISAREQKLKIKYQVNYKEGEVIYEGKSLVIIILIGFIGGLVAGALGLGGGSIYNPALLSLGVHPKSSGATGMFLVLFATINTCLINFLNGYLDITYACWISTFSLAGSILGMWATDRVVRLTGKPSIMVWVLVFVFILSTISTPVFGGFSLRDQAQDGTDIFAFNNLCKTDY